MKTRKRESLWLYEFIKNNLHEPVLKRFSLFKSKIPDFEPDAKIGQISADFEMGRFAIGSHTYFVLSLFRVFVIII